MSVRVLNFKTKKQSWALFIWRNIGSGTRGNLWIFWRFIISQRIIQRQGMKKQLCLFERLTCGVRVLASASVLSTYVDSYQFISEFICQNYHFVLCHSHLKIPYSARHVRDRQRAHELISVLKVPICDTDLKTNKQTSIRGKKSWSGGRSGVNRTVLKIYSAKPYQFDKWVR